MISTYMAPNTTRGRRPVVLSSPVIRSLPLSRMHPNYVSLKVDKQTGLDVLYVDTVVDIWIGIRRLNAYA